MKKIENQSCQRVASLVLQKDLRWVLHGPAKRLPDSVCFTVPLNKQQHLAPHSGNMSVKICSNSSGSQGLNQ